MGTNVRDVMTARPRCAAPDTPLSQVAQLMEAEDVGAIPILDGDQLVGMITDRDIVVRAIAKEKDPRGMPSTEISSGELVTVGPDHDLSDALPRWRGVPGRRRARGEGQVRGRDAG
jgi:CBS domain-containing protein